MDVVDVLEKILEKLRDIDTNIDIMDAKIDKIEESVQQLEEKMSKNIPPVREPFRIIKIKINYDEGLKHVAEHKIESDIALIKKVYIDQVKEPAIRYVNRNVYQYWIDGRWKDDIDGKYISKTISRCLASYYRAVIGALLGQGQVYLDHMQYIGKIETEKYYKELAIELKKVIAIGD